MAFDSIFIYQRPLAAVVNNLSSAYSMVFLGFSRFSYKQSRTDQPICSAVGFGEYEMQIGWFIIGLVSLENVTEIQSYCVVFFYFYFI